MKGYIKKKFKFNCRIIYLQYCDGIFIVIKIMNFIMIYIVLLSLMKLTGWQKEIGLGLEKIILQDKAYGLICSLFLLYGLIIFVIDIKIKLKSDIKIN